MAGMIPISVLMVSLGVGADPIDGASVLPNMPVSVVAPASPAGEAATGAVAEPADETQPVQEAAPIVPESVASEIQAREALPLGAGPSGESSDRGADGSGVRESAGPGMGVVQTIAATGGVIALIFAARWVVVRMARVPVGSSSLRSQLGMGGRAPSGVLFVLGRYPVSRGMSLVLIQLDRRVLLLSQSGTGFQTLAEVREAEEVASIISKARDEEGESLSAKFSSLMRTFDRTHVETEREESLRSIVRPARVGDEATGSVDGVDGVAAEDSPEAVRARLMALRALVS